MDAALSIADHHALDLHARVERWALDEVPLPGKLVHQIVEWLYRENRFCRGALKVGTTISLDGVFSIQYGPRVPPGTAGRTVAGIENPCIAR
jgi:hypothetical protein